MDNRCEICGGALGTGYNCLSCGNQQMPGVKKDQALGTVTYKGLERIEPIIAPDLSITVLKLIEKVNHIGEILNAQIRSK